MQDDPSGFDRRNYLKGLAAGAGTWIAAGAGAWILRPAWANAQTGPIKIGIATDITGPMAYAGNSCWQTAQMVVEEINAAGGIAGRPVQLHMEDTASNESTAVSNVRRLVQRERVDVVFGGITSSMRQASWAMARCRCSACESGCIDRPCAVAASCARA